MNRYGFLATDRGAKELWMHALVNLLKDPTAPIAGPIISQVFHPIFLYEG